VDNFSVSVWENNGELVFLRKVVKWWVKKSFWLEVAKIAWLDNDVITEAKDMLRKLELEHSGIFWKQLSIWEPVYESIPELIAKNSKVEEELKALNIDEISPIEALNLLVELKNKL
jgi:DNA mismatch repair protein MutS